MSTPDRTETLLRSRVEMAAEGRRIVDAARGLTLRLIVGLAVRATAQADTGFLAAPGEQLGVDMSTVSPAESRELAAEARRHRVRVLDAPVSGSLG
jgi:3-hydroxyisobutyrate dehydrogenase-like beta-hydroxyacid dehydrogenase